MINSVVYGVELQTLEKLNAEWEAFFQDMKNTLLTDRSSTEVVQRGLQNCACVLLWLALPLASLVMCKWWELSTHSAHWTSYSYAAVGQHLSTFLKSTNCTYVYSIQKFMFLAMLWTYVAYCSFWDLNLTLTFYELPMKWSFIGRNF